MIKDMTLKKEQADFITFCMWHGFYTNSRAGAYAGGAIPFLGGCMLGTIMAGIGGASFNNIDGSNTNSPAKDIVMGTGYLLGAPAAVPGAIVGAALSPFKMFYLTKTRHVEHTNHEINSLMEKIEALANNPINAKIEKIESSKIKAIDDESAKLLSNIAANDNGEITTRVNTIKENADGMIQRLRAAEKPKQESSDNKAIVALIDAIKKNYKPSFFSSSESSKKLFAILNSDSLLLSEKSKAIKDYMTAKPDYILNPKKFDGQLYNQGKKLFNVIAECLTKMESTEKSTPRIQ